MDNDLGLFGKNYTLSEIIDEVPYTYWLLTIMQEFVLHISSMLHTVHTGALQKQIHEHEHEPSDVLSVHAHQENCQAAPKLIRTDKFDSKIKMLVIVGHDMCCIIPPMLEKMIISRGMLSFLMVLRKSPIPIIQDTCMQRWKTSVDLISQSMLAQARLRFGEQHNVYGLRDDVRLRRVESDPSSTIRHDMLQNNYAFITLQNVDSAHEKFHTLLSTFMSSMAGDTAFSINFDFFFMAFLCPSNQPIPTYDTTSGIHRKPSTTNSVSTHESCTSNFSRAMHDDSFAYKIVQCMHANNVLPMIRNKNWHPIDTELPHIANTM